MLQTSYFVLKVVILPCSIITKKQCVLPFLGTLSICSIARNKTKQNEFLSAENVDVGYHVYFVRCLENIIGLMETVLQRIEGQLWRVPCLEKITVPMATVLQRIATWCRPLRYSTSRGYR
jgi:hypothetical protein